MSASSVILATGGHAMVKAAYSSGKPAFGVGPGNVPVLVDTSADLEDAVAKIVAGKSFDYGTVCSSEQALVAEYTLRDRILALLKQHKAYLCNDQQTDALGKLLLTPNWTVNPQCVGQAPTKIAQMAGFEVPADTSIICCEIAGVGKKFPLSAEKLSPVLSLLFVADYATALDTCFGLLKFGGAGHTAAIYAKNDTRIREYGMRMPAMRVLVNTPAPQGSTGITTNVFPSMTLGCGAMAGNSTSDNVGPLHLINIKRLAYTVRTPEEAFEMPLDYDKAPDSPCPPPAAVGAIDRAAVVSAVERYLASRGIAVSAPRRIRARGFVLRMLHAGSAQSTGSAVRGGQRRRRSGRPLSGPPRQLCRPVRRNPAAIADCQTPAQKRLHRPMLHLPNRWSSSARRMCARPSKRTARSISGRRRSLHLRPATWPIPLIFWCWLRAEEATWT